MCFSKIKSLKNRGGKKAYWLLRYVDTDTPASPRAYLEIEIVNDVAAPAKVPMITVPKNAPLNSL